MTEENAAGRIVARGFMDELNKLAAKAARPSKAPGRQAEERSRSESTDGEKPDSSKEEAAPAEEGGWSEAQG
jgi:hypothetical protein